MSHEVVSSVRTEGKEGKRWEARAATCWRQPGDAHSASLVHIASSYWGLALELGEALSWDAVEMRMKAGLSSV